MMIALACAFAMVSAQAQESANNDTTIYTIVDEMPQFQGGDSALVEYITHNVHYPQAEKAQGIQGKVFVGFVVEKDGSISNVEVKRGIGEECDAEAVRVIKDMHGFQESVTGNPFASVPCCPSITKSLNSLKHQQIPQNGYLWKECPLSLMARKDCWIS